MLARWGQLCIALLAAVCTAACASAPATPSTAELTTQPIQNLTPRVVIVTATPSMFEAPGTAATATELPLPTLLPSVTPLIPTDTPTVAAPTTAATAALVATRRPAVATNVPPGVYVTALRVEPARPIRGAPVSFSTTFLNTTDAPKSYNWLVLIYRPGQKNSFGETSALNVMLPTGTTQLASASNWRIPVNGDCESFYAQANWQDTNKVRTAFTSLEGQILSLDFQVCPK